MKKYDINENITKANKREYDYQFERRMNAAKSLYGHTKLEEIYKRIHEKENHNTSQIMIDIENEIDKFLSKTA